MLSFSVPLKLRRRPYQSFTRVISTTTQEISSQHVPSIANTSTAGLVKSRSCYRNMLAVPEDFLPRTGPETAGWDEWEVG